MGRVPVLQGQARRCADHAALSHYQLGKLWKFYRKLASRSPDTGTTPDGHETITLQALYDHIKEPLTDFSLRLFALLDKEEVTDLMWEDFCLLIVTVCMMEREDMRKFAFYAMDRGGIGGLQIDEYRALIEELHGGRLNNDDEDAILTCEFDDTGLLVGYPQFVKMDTNYPHLLAPAFRLQRQMAEASFSDTGWHKQREKVAALALEAKNLPAKKCMLAIKKEKRHTLQLKSDRKGCLWTCGYNCSERFLKVCKCCRHKMEGERAIAIHEEEGPDAQHVFPQKIPTHADRQPPRIGRFQGVDKMTLAIITQPKAILAQGKGTKLAPIKSAASKVKGLTDTGTLAEVDASMSTEEKQAKTDERRRRTEERKSRRAKNNLDSGVPEPADVDGKKKRRHKTKDKEGSGKIVPAE